MSQGWLLVPASPRSCELSPGHSLEPSARYAGVCPVRDRRTNRVLDTSWARHRCGPPRPVPRGEDHRCALRIGTGRGEYVPILFSGQQKRFEILLLSFLKTRNSGGFDCALRRDRPAAPSPSAGFNGVQPCCSVACAAGSSVRFAQIDAAQGLPLLAETEADTGRLASGGGRL